MTSETVKNHSLLTLHYRVTSSDGIEFVSTFGSHPATLQLGTGELAEPLEKCLLGMRTGQRGVFDLAPDQALGLPNPQLIQPYKPLILTLLMLSDQWEVRAHVCLMLPLLQLTQAERQQAFDTMRQWLADKSSIVRTFALQTMYDLAQHDHSLLDEALLHLQHALAKGTPAMRARARLILTKNQ